VVPQRLTFIAATWLVGAIVLAVFGPRTRQAHGSAQDRKREAVGMS
jgi:putative MFS transporter